MTDRSWFARATVRVLDIGLGIPIALLVVPLIVLAAIVSSLSLRAWPFFVQDRVGLDQRRFRLVKIRTLPRTVPPYVAKYDLAGQQVPRLAQFLRDTHLDELPQILHVLSGRMSLVGPRPEMPPLHAAMAPDAAHRRTGVRPGCTGLWQISPASAGLIHEAPQYDQFYVENHTLRLDLWILARTPLVLVSLKARTTLTAVPQWTTRSLGRRSAPAGDSVLQPTLD